MFFYVASANAYIRTGIVKINNQLYQFFFQFHNKKLIFLFYLGIGIMVDKCM